MSKGPNAKGVEVVGRRPHDAVHFLHPSGHKDEQSKGII
jgi:hypothetical protein